jgi:putative tryptophan/tyrosine transport system substrate-binding protein
MPVVGFLHVAAAAPMANNVAGFLRGLGEAGFVPGQNVATEYRWAEGRFERVAELAGALVQRQVSVIVSGGGPATVLAAKAATSAIPIVFVSGDDPVKHGVVANLNRPGGNITGISFLTTELVTKRLELLRELLPTAKVIAFFQNPNNPEAAGEARDVQIAAAKLSQKIAVFSATTADEIGSAFAALVEQRVDAILFAFDPFFLSSRDQLSALAIRHAIPAIFITRDHASSGGLVSYGANIPDAYREAGVYTGTILKGARPADLPVMQPTKFELVVNLRTATVIGLKIPESFLLRADEIIE